MVKKQKYFYPNMTLLLLAPGMPGAKRRWPPAGWDASPYWQRLI
jgi:hypothetical protein